MATTGHEPPCIAEVPDGDGSNGNVD